MTAAEHTYVAQNALRNSSDKILTGQSPVRILFFDHTASLGGGEIALLHLVSNLDRALYTPIVLLGAGGDLKDRLQTHGVETHVMPLAADIVSTRKDSLGPRSALRLGTLLRLARYAGKLGGFIRAQAIDIVHTNSLKSDILGGIAGRLAGVPVIWHVRDRISSDYLPDSVVRVFRVLCRHIPNFVIANSAATLETLKLPGSQRSLVIHDAVGPHYAERAAAPLARRPRSERLRIGLVGRITEWKGQHIFIRAAQRVAASLPDAEFFIIGSAMFGEHAYEDELHKLAQECGVENKVSFLGFRPDVDTLIESLDVLVHASVVPEPFGQVVIEGMAAGTPVVATRGGGVTEIVEDGITGTLVSMGSVEEMADAVIATLCNNARTEKMIVAARKAVLERFTIQTPVEKVQALYTRVLQRRGVRTANALAAGVKSP